MENCNGATAQGDFNSISWYIALLHLMGHYYPGQWGGVFNINYRKMVVKTIVFHAKSLKIHCKMTTTSLKCQMSKCHFWFLMCHWVSNVNKSLGQYGF